MTSGVGVPEQMPGPVYQGVPPPPRRSMLPIIIALLIMVGVVLFVIGYVLIASSGGDNESPEDTIEDYVAAMERLDFGDMYNETVFAFSDMYDEWWEEMEMDWFEGMELSLIVSSMDVTYLADLSLSEQDEAADLMDAVEYFFDVNVTDYCTVDASITITVTYMGTTVSDTEDLDVALVEIDGKWYLVEPDYMLYDGGLETTPLVSLSRTTVANGVRMEVVSISESDVSWNDVYFMLTADIYWVEWYPEYGILDNGYTEMVELGEEWLGSSPMYMNVTDLAGNGVIDEGDYVTITSSSDGWYSSTLYSLSVYHRATYGLMGILYWSP